MERGKTHYKRRKRFFFFCLFLLCSNPVKATETDIDSSKEDRSENCGSLTPSEETLPSSDNELRGLLANDEREESEEDEQQARRVEKTMHLNLSKYIKSRCRNCMGGEGYERLEQDFLALLEQVNQSGQFEKFCKAFSVRNLNLVFRIGDDNLYDILTNYLTLTNIPNHYKQLLIMKIKASDIFPKEFRDSCKSVTRRWGWATFASGTVTSFVAPLYIYFVNQKLPMFDVWWLGTIICGLCWPAACFACFSHENARIRLARVCIAPATKLKCHQKVAMVDLGCLER